MSADITQNGVLRFCFQNRNDKFIEHRESYKILRNAVSQNCNDKLIEM